MIHQTLTIILLSFTKDTRHCAFTINNHWFIILDKNHFLYSSGYWTMSFTYPFVFDNNFTYWNLEHSAAITKRPNDISIKSVRRPREYQEKRKM